MTQPPNPLVVAAGRANGKVTLFYDGLAEDRYEAAIRLEKARQNIREHLRYGFPVTRALTAEAQTAEAAYSRTTAAIAAAEAAGTPRVGRHRYASA